MSSRDETDRRRRRNSDTRRGRVAPQLVPNPDSVARGGRCQEPRRRLELPRIRGCAKWDSRPKLTTHPQRHRARTTRLRPGRSRPGRTRRRAAAPSLPRRSATRGGRQEARRDPARDRRASADERGRRHVRRRARSQVVVTPALRRWWLDRYTLDEIRVMAAELVREQYPRARVPSLRDAYSRLRPDRPTWCDRSLVGGAFRRTRWGRRVRPARPWRAAICIGSALRSLTTDGTPRSATRPRRWISRSAGISILSRCRSSSSRCPRPSPSSPSSGGVDLATTR